MTHYQARMDADLDALKARVLAVARAVRVAVGDSVRGLIEDDDDRLYQVMLGDHPINREVRSIDKATHAFVARHLPAAGPLRFVSAVLRLNIALERIGDYAVTIGRVGVRINAGLPPKVAEDIDALAQQALRMLEQAVTAFDTGDIELARRTIALAKKVDVKHDAVFRELVDQDTSRPLREVVGVLTIYAQLERVSDQAKNMCEEAIFVTTGETKRPKRYQVLFVDADNALHSQLAVALAQKSYPESGLYSSAGLNPASELDPRLTETAASLGLHTADFAPKPLPEIAQSHNSIHVLVALGLDRNAALPTLPFHTVLLRWPVDAAASLEEVARDFNGRIAELMGTLRGDTAS